MIQKILQDINRLHKNSQKKKYYDELIFKSKNKTKTTWKIIKKEIGNNCQNSIKTLKINKTISNNPQEIANTFNNYFSTVTDTVIGNIIEGNNDFKGNVDPSKYLTLYLLTWRIWWASNNASKGQVGFNWVFKGLITDFNNTFSSINWKYATTNEINKIIKSLRTKTSYGYYEIPIKILKLSAPFIISP